MTRIVRIAAVLAAAYAVLPAAAESSVSSRLKWATTVYELTDSEGESNQEYDHLASIRLMFESRNEHIEFRVDPQLTWFRSALLGSGNVIAEGGGFGSDGLTWDIEDSNEQLAQLRFDRLYLRAQTPKWSMTVGRQAVSWGSGLVFQPLDMFSPYPPAAIDRDYKPGVDVILVERLFDNGDDVQLLVVDQQNSWPRDASVAVKWHGQRQAVDTEVLLGRHFDDTVIGAMARVPISTALLRTDIARVCGSDSECDTSLVVNLDSAFSVGRMPVSVFGEYYHNGFGVEDVADAADSPDLLERIARGELFGVGRQYVASGLALTWHPLISQNVTWIRNMNDKSEFVQTSIRYDRSDSVSMYGGFSVRSGDRDTEYGQPDKDSGVEIIGRYQVFVTILAYM